MFEDRCVVEDALKGEARQVDGSELAVRQQLRHRPAGGRGLLQAVTGKAIAKHQVGDIRVVADDGILKYCSKRQERWRDAWLECMG